MRVLVYGAGGIGSVLGAALLRAGHEVSLVGRAEPMHAAREGGLAVTGIWGEWRARPHQAVERLEELQGGEVFDWVFLTVKSYDTAAAMQALKGFPGMRRLCAFQNGLGNYERISEAVDPRAVALGRVIFGVKAKPGEAEVTVSGGDVLIGCPHPEGPREGVRELAQAFCGGGIQAREHPDILQALWGKVLYNCALNGLATVMEIPYGGLLERDATRRIMEGVIAEAYAVARACGQALQPQDSAAYLRLLYGELIPATAQHYPSMFQDAQAGKRTEIAALNGAIERLGAGHGVATPYNSLVTRLVREMERRRGIPPAA